MPDLASLKSPSPSKTKQEEVKLPDNDDLEFPDIGLIQQSVNHSTHQSQGVTVESTQFISMAIPKPPPPKMETKSSTPTASDDEVHYPDEDDLEFPDLDSMKSEATMLTSPKIEKGKVDLSHQYTRTVALDNQQKQTEFPKVMGESAEQRNEEDEEDWEFDVKLNDSHSLKSESLTQVDTEIDVPLPKDSTRDSKDEKKAKPNSQGDFEFEDLEESDQPKSKKSVTNKQAPEDKKLLFERKVKSPKSPASLRDPEREMQSKKTQHVGEPLKKRNDNYLFFILVIIILIIVAVFFYFKEILNKPLPV
jgi:hypothetical protein